MAGSPAIDELAPKSKGSVSRKVKTGGLLVRGCLGEATRPMVVHANTSCAGLAASDILSSREYSAWTSALVSLVDISELSVPLLLKQRTRQGRVADAHIKSAKLVDAQKYRVAEDAFYVEANFAVAADLVIEDTIYLNTVLGIGSFEPPLEATLPGTLSPAQVWNPQPLRPAWNTPMANQPYKPFALLGTTRSIFAPPVSGAGYEPTVVQQTFDAELSVRFSIRLSGKKRESLQLEDIEIQKVARPAKPVIKPQTQK